MLSSGKRAASEQPLAISRSSFTQRKAPPPDIRSILRFGGKRGFESCGWD